MLLTPVFFVILLITILNLAPSILVIINLIIIIPYRCIEERGAVRGKCPNLGEGHRCTLHT